jgi:hypothetical protein
MYLIAQHTGDGCPGPDCSFVFQLIKVDSVSYFGGSIYTPHALRLPRPIYGKSEPQHAVVLLLALV